MSWDHNLLAVGCARCWREVINEKRADLSAAVPKVLLRQVQQLLRGSWNLDCSDHQADLACALEEEQCSFSVSRNLPTRTAASSRIFAVNLADSAMP